MSTVGAGDKGIEITPVHKKSASAPKKDPEIILQTKMGGGQKKIVETGSMDFSDFAEKRVLRHCPAVQL